MPNNETKLILDKINDLKEFTNQRIDDLKCFQIKRYNELAKDISEVKESAKEHVNEFKKYSEQHYSYHRREKKVLLKWIFGLAAVTIIIAAAGIGPYISPYILSLLRFIF